MDRRWLGLGKEKGSIMGTGEWVWESGVSGVLCQWQLATNTSVLSGLPPAIWWGKLPKHFPEVITWFAQDFTHPLTYLCEWFRIYIHSTLQGQKALDIVKVLVEWLHQTNVGWNETNSNLNKVRQRGRCISFVTVIFVSKHTKWELLL